MKKIMILLSVTTFLVMFYFVYNYYTSVETLSRYGSSGQEVINIQTRLSNWGYYTGSIDGVYGWRTAQAVRYFQSVNGLTVDGIAGSNTLTAMGLPTGASNNNNTDLLARVINGEARGEPYIGQVAVGAVVLNRVSHPSFPKTIAGVVYQPGAFTAVDDGQINASIRSTSVKAAQDALNGWDPSYNAIYYYNPAKTTNAWIWSRPVTVVIGDHIFAR